MKMGCHGNADSPRGSWQLLLPWKPPLWGPPPSSDLASHKRDLNIIFQRPGMGEEGGRRKDTSDATITPSLTSVSRAPGISSPPHSGREGSPSPPTPRASATHPSWVSPPSCPAICPAQVPTLPLRLCSSHLRPFPQPLSFHIHRTPTLLISGCVRSEGTQRGPSLVS